MELRGRVAVVTGAASGIGRAMALALARGGATVVVADLDEVGNLGTLRAISEAGGNGATVRVDVTNEADVRGMLDFARQQGGLDILCNNAGIGEQPDDLFGDGDAWRRLIDINFAGVVLGTRLGVLAMREHGGGLIVNTASMGGLLPMPDAPVYAATKAAVVHLTRSLAYLKDEANVRVCAICPSYIDTPLLWQGTPDHQEHTRATAAAIGGPLTPERVAEGLLELVRDDTRAGAILRVTPQRGLDYAREIHP
jgi:NAD(P)-dependent dehydrogenase (short-subunit alcohol dehydrogenase family)